MYSRNGFEPPLLGFEVNPNAPRRGSSMSDQLMRLAKECREHERSATRIQNLENQLNQKKREIESLRRNYERMTAEYERLDSEHKKQNVELKEKNEKLDNEIIDLKKKMSENTNIDALIEKLNTEWMESKGLK